MMRVAQEIEKRLQRTFAPTVLDLIDESHRHTGHAGARPQGESHFRLTIASEGFAGQSRLERQRAIYAALGDLMTTDIHALAITALTPAEADARTDVRT